ncbi:hypothetical protein MASR1M66_21620 [Aminivibrio sp.]
MWVRSGGKAGVGEGLEGGVEGQDGAGLVVLGEVSGGDAGAGHDPFVGRVDAALEVRIGHDGPGQMQPQSGNAAR